MRLYVAFPDGVICLSSFHPGGGITSASPASLGEAVGLLASEEDLCCMAALHG